MFGILVNLKFIRVGENPYTCIGIENVPLPCIRAMWDAKSKSDWEAASRPDAATRRGKKLVYGDLIKSLSLKDEPVASTRIDELSEWCANLDGLGSLVYLMASAG